VVVAIIAAAVGTGYFLAPRVSEQLNQLVTQLPAAFHRFLAPVEQTHWGNILLRAFEPSTAGASPGMVRGIFGVASSTVDVIAALIIVAFIGLYPAIDPATYLAGCLRLVPRARRERMRTVAQEVGRTLRWWLAGRILSMALIAIMALIGLWLLGVQLAFTLGLLAGLLAFIPYIGSISSAIPAILVALTQDSRLALYVVVLYVGVHLVEGYVLVPLMQKRMVHLPPALTLAAQALLGALFGILGLALATPLAAASVTAIRLLYIEDVLHDSA
jgi:predicted PurR-regulated permease PerM